MFGEINAGATGTGAVAELIDNTAVLVTPAKTAEMVAEVDVMTVLVVTVKLALVAPAKTVTLAGTVAETESSESVTTTPPLGAAALKVTVPVELLLPITLVGLRAIAESVVGVAPSVISKSACGPGEVAPTTRELMFKLNCPVTVEVAMTKLALVALAGIVTM